jgi:hypothetical protein
VTDAYGNSVDREIVVPVQEEWHHANDAILSAYHEGYRAGQADEHARWHEALERLVLVREGKADDGKLAGPGMIQCPEVMVGGGGYGRCKLEIGHTGHHIEASWQSVNRSP